MNLFRKRLGFKMTFLISALILVSCTVIMATCIWIFSDVSAAMSEIREEAVMDGYRSEIKSEVQSSIALIQNYYDSYESGEMSEADAKTSAEAAVRALRYGDSGNGYMWIDNRDYTLVMHPILPEQEGTNRKDLTDKQGTKIIQTIFQSVDSGDGFSRFWFTKADGVTVAEKLAYSQEFKPWDWVITTGVYMDDVREESSNARIRTMFTGSSVFILVETCVLWLLSIVVAHFMSSLVMKGINRISSDLDAIATGELRNEVSPKLLKRDDELGEIAKSLEAMQTSLATTVASAQDAADNVMKSSASLTDVANTTLEATSEITTAVSDIANTATSQASAAQSVTTNITGINKNVDDVGAAVSEISKRAQHMHDSSTTMKSSVESMLASSDKVSEDIHGIDTKIKETNSVIEEVKGIISVIEDIADQTKLLSLNASIEAARAGEAGKGFAVVASTIREMSDSTAQQVAEIKHIITTLVSDFGECLASTSEVVVSNSEQSTSMHNMVSSFEELEADIAATSTSVKSISSLMQSTIEEATEVTSQAKSLSDASETSAASTEEVNASIEELSALTHAVLADAETLKTQADTLNEKLGVFKI